MHVHHVEDMGGGRHVGHVELTHLVDVREDLGQLAGHARGFVLLETQAGEFRDVADVVFTDHGVFLLRRAAKAGRL